MSPETPISARTETGDGKSLWLEFVLDQAFVPVGSDVMDAIPDVLASWTVDLRDGVAVCSADGGHELIAAPLETSDMWRDSVRSEGQCLVVVAGLGLSTNEVGIGFHAALNAMADRGLVVAATVSAGPSI